MIASKEKKSGPEVEQISCLLAASCDVITLAYEEIGEVEKRREYKTDCDEDPGIRTHQSALSAKTIRNMYLKV